MSNNGSVETRDLDVVFVCGASRSGTTMTSRIIGRSATVHTMQELHYFEGIWDPSDDTVMDATTAHEALARLVGIERGGFRHPTPSAECRDEASTILAALQTIDGPSVYAAFLGHRAAATGSTRCCDQTPRNVYLLEQLLDIYPLARAVIVVRDPRDVLLSQKNRWRRHSRGIDTMSRRDQMRLWSGYHPITMSHLWKSAAASADRVADHPRVHVVRFEDLVADPSTTVESICQQIGVPFDADLLAIAQSGSSHRPTVAGSTGFDRTAIGRWRNGGLTPTEIATTDRIAGEYLTAHGYERSGVQASPLRSACSWMTLPIKGALALALNLSRSRRLLRAALRRFRRSPRAAPSTPALADSDS